MQIVINGQTIELIRGDLTHQKVDAIVNSADERLSGGGGIDFAIHHAAGPKVLQEIKERYPDGCKAGSAVITSAGELPEVKHIIHAVGPLYSDDGDSKLLTSAYYKSLELAVEHHCESVAFTAISGRWGTYHYPVKKIAQIALQTTKEFLIKKGRPSLVRFVLFERDDLNLFKWALYEIKERAT